MGNILGLATPLTNVGPNTKVGILIDIIVSSIALGYIAIFADYVATFNPSNYIRKVIRRCLIKIGIVQTDIPLQYPLAYSYGSRDEHNLEDSVSAVHSKSIIAGPFPTTTATSDHEE